VHKTRLCSVAMTKRAVVPLDMRPVWSLLRSLNPVLLVRALARVDYGVFDHPGHMLSIPFDHSEVVLYLQRMPFARVQGSMQWCCPYCSHLNRSTLHYRTGWKVQCNGSDCRRTVAIGLTFYPMTTGFKVPPTDAIMPIEISTEKWHSGEPVNRLVGDSNLQPSG
jgi:hypothetical protein